MWGGGGGGDGLRLYLVGWALKGTAYLVNHNHLMTFINKVLARLFEIIIVALFHGFMRK